jgi:hypothetical protein
MPYCRDCENEFAELIPWCPNCGALDVDEFTEWEEGLMADEELVVVYDAMDDIQALLYRTMLEEAGIAVVERPMEVTWLEGVKVEALHSQLMVREEDVNRATKLVESFRREAEEGQLAAEEPPAEPEPDTESMPDSF